MVSSRVARTAVYRNRVRRALSAAVEGLLNRMSPAKDIVVVITKKAEIEALRTDLMSTLNKAHIA